MPANPLFKSNNGLKEAPVGNIKIVTTLAVNAAVNAITGPNRYAIVAIKRKGVSDTNYTMRKPIDIITNRRESVKYESD